MSGRRLGAALAVGVVLALIVDMSLQIGLDAVRIQASTVPWQAIATSKAVWLMAIAIGATVAPWLLPIARSPLTWRDAYHIAGIVLLSAPLVWTASTVLVFIVDVPLTRSSFYAELIMQVAPWLLSGAALRAAATHFTGD